MTKNQKRIVNCVKIIGDIVFWLFIFAVSMKLIGGFVGFALPFLFFGLCVLGKRSSRGI